jgi:hypothetical protein
MSYRLSSERLGDPEPGVHALLDVPLQSLPEILNRKNRFNHMKVNNG